MTPAALAEGLSALLREQFGTPVRQWEPTEQGMNSVTVLVRPPEGQWIAKWVPREGATALRTGVLVAEEVAALGVRSGAPLRWATGDVTHVLDGGEVALLDVVEGEPLTSHASDQPDWGRALGGLHRLLARPAGSMDEFLAAVGLASDLPRIEPWVAEALGDVLDEIRAMRGLRWVQLHTDPTPDAFRRGADGVVGMIDWSGSVAGPALYDVASAVMYAGGLRRSGRLLEAYDTAVAPVPGSESDHLSAFSRLRAVVQAVYFSRRLAAGDLTGVDSPEDNEHGLADARRMVVEGWRSRQ